MLQSKYSSFHLVHATDLPRRPKGSGRLRLTKKEVRVSMLYDSTKVLLRSILWSLQTTDKVGWEDHVESGSQCLYEIHQMARPKYQAYRADPASKGTQLVPVYERAARAIPHVKSMVRAIRRKDQATAVESGRAALAEM